MSENELNDRINQFLESKKIENSFFRECIVEFIQGHDKEFGNVVSIDELFKRLEDNLDKITFKGKNGTILGEYNKRNEEFEEQNEILIYADESDLELSEYDKKHFDIYAKADQQEILQKRDERRNEIKNTIIHELTHAAYTKQMEYGQGDSHVFQDTVKDSFSENGMSIRKSKLLNVGKGYYIEGIINYISSRIKEGGETYKYQTKAIELLADKIGEENIIKAAWESREDILKTAYINSVGKNEAEGEKGYSLFDSSMKLLSIIEKESEMSRYHQRGEKEIDHITKLLDGRMILSENEKKLTEIKSISKKEEGKSGFDDVVETDITKTLSNRATNFIKNMYKTIQAKITGKENIENKNIGNGIEL